MRGVGQTQNLIDNLPNERCVIVTSTHDIGKAIKGRIEEARGKEAAKKIKFITISSFEDTRKMMGLSIPIFFDHSFFNLSEIETAKEALQLAHGASTVYNHQKGILK